MSEQWTALERNVRGILDACESHNGIEHPDSFVSEIYVYAKNVEAAVGEAKRRESERPIHGFSASTNLPDTAGLLGRLGVAEARVAELERVVKAAKAFVATTTRYWNASIDAREAVEEERDRLAEENDELRKNIARLAGALAVHEHGDALRKLADS